MFPPSPQSPSPFGPPQPPPQPPAKEKRIRFRTAVTALLAAAAVGAGTAAVVTATLDSNNNGQTVTRNVTVTNAQNTSSATALSVNGVWNRAKDSVVDIKVQTTSDLGQQGEAQGSGWVYSKAGYIVTNDHVVSGASSVTVTFPSTRATYKATVVGADPSTDIAVIKINAPASLVKPLPVGNSSKLVVGDPVVAVGSPFGLDNTVTAGIVSALHRQIDAPNNFTINDAIQTDAAINHGNSGGPLFNLRGQVVGVNAQIQSDSGDNAGIGFAIPSDTVKSIADQLITKGNVQHAYLGVSITDIPSAVSGQLGEAAGVAVRAVVAGKPAAKSGLKAATSTRALDGQQYPTGGDVITAVDGQQVTTAAELQSLVDGHQPGDKVQLSVTRNGSSRTVTVTLGTRPAQAS
jgi:putative serine protease PepD